VSPVKPVTVTAAETPLGSSRPTPAVARAVDTPTAADTGPISPSLPPSPPPNGFSLARQLGLGASRVVIDPGHGGHDPGAKGPGIWESRIVLDIGLRLEKLLARTGIEVVMTRRTDVYVPLEERTAMANRSHGDLFLSIHANASRKSSARGVETYVLNFASNPEAEAVAARENAATGRTMSSLSDMVKAIALNNKLDESRTLAGQVQREMVKRLAESNRGLRDHGIRQAPFVVLIGAAMPSVLVEVSFITHSQEGRLLKSAAYRQKIAEALAEAVRGYQRSLKGTGVPANQ
jgi:N-acetylmuramoyl-L-alanine amidase